MDFKLSLICLFSGECLVFSRLHYDVQHWHTDGDDAVMQCWRRDVAVTVATCVWSLYQDTSYPYESGPLSVQSLIYTPSLMPLNSPPIHTRGEYMYLHVARYVTFAVIISIVITACVVGLQYTHLLSLTTTQSSTSSTASAASTRPRSTTTSCPTFPPTGKCQAVIRCCAACIEYQVALQRFEELWCLLQLRRALPVGSHRRRRHCFQLHGTFE